MENLTPTLISWASILEDSTRAQAVRRRAMPFIHPHLALMPDAHLGKGATVGSVIPTLGAIIPAAVGVDIGCGMIAVRTQSRAEDLPGDRRPLREAIERAVPLSAGADNRTVARARPRPRLDELRALAADGRLRPGVVRARTGGLQLGTLGSGNHFIEVSLDETDRVWLFLHSGSRGVGNKIAQRHIAVAQELCGSGRIDAAGPRPGLPRGGHGGVRRLHPRAAVGAAVRAAQPRGDDGPGRRVQFGEWVGGAGRASWSGSTATTTTPQQETPLRQGRVAVPQGRDRRRGRAAGPDPGLDGHGVVRRGRARATRCRSTRRPHGAGREYSRTRGPEDASPPSDLRAAMAGIEYRDTDAFIDEIPAAYKDIDQVMADAADLVEVRHMLRQLVNVKGD